MYKVTAIYVCVADSRTGSVAVQPHTVQNFNLAIEHTMSLTDEMGTRAFDTFIGVCLDKNFADLLVTQWQAKFLDDLNRADAVMDTYFAGLTRREVRGRDIWSDDPDRTTRRGL